MEYLADEAFHSAIKTDGKYVFPAQVSYIDSCALSNAMVSDIVIDERNTVYKSEDHALLSKDGAQLILYSACAKEKRYSVPEGVTNICRECFNVMQDLEKPYIPVSVTEIEDPTRFDLYPAIRYGTKTCTGDLL